MNTKLCKFLRRAAESFTRGEKQKYMIKEKPTLEGLKIQVYVNPKHVRGTYLALKKQAKKEGK